MGEGREEESSMETADFNPPLLFTELAEAMGELEPGNDLKGGTKGGNCPSHLIFYQKVLKPSRAGRRKAVWRQQTSIHPSCSLSWLKQWAS